MGGFNFSPENFGLGVLTGWGTAYALFRARTLISDLTGSVSERATQAQEFAARSGDSSYINDILKFIEVDHLAGSQVKLSEIVVEPRFLKAPKLIEPEEEDVRREVFYMVPRLHDHPYLHAPYNIPTLSIDDLDNGDRSLALLGLPGSGRTTALHAIALWSLGRVEFAPPKDKVQRRLEEEEGASTTKEDRAIRYTDQIRAEEIARNALADKDGVSRDSIAGRTTGGDSFRKLTPMYTHLANINVTVSEFGRNVDPAEPLVRALQHYVGYATRLRIPRNIYQRLEEGKVLLLLDGFDELPPAEQKRKLAWLKAFRETYSNNFIIVVGAPSGYGGLMRAGYTPVYMRPWLDTQNDDLANKFAQHWGQLNLRRRRNATVDRDTVTRVKEKARILTPYELTTRAWAMYESPEQTRLPAWMNNLFSHMLPNQDLDALMPKLIAAAKLQFKEGFFTAQRLDAELKLLQANDDDVTLTTEVAAVDADDMDDGLDDLDSALDEIAAINEITLEDDLDALAAELDSDLDDLDNIQGEDEDNVPEDLDDLLGALDVDTAVDADEKRQLDRETNQFINMLVKANILRAYRGGRYLFAHQLTAAYLGSLYLKDVRFDKLLRRSYEPEWKQAFIFLGAHRPLDDLAKAHMEDPSDLMLTNLLTITQWLRHIQGTAEWVRPLMTMLGKLFTARSQYPVLRERIAAALIGSRDRNAARIFERAITHPDPDVRRLSCLGLGALRHANAVPDLAAAVRDQVVEVQLAAVLALGAVGSDEALEEMAEIFIGGSEIQQQAAAETLALFPEIGYETLYDASTADDLLLRRAAVYGLSRVPSPWALIALYEAVVEEDEFIVQAAAETAFEDMQHGDMAKGPQRYPRPISIEWVTVWLNALDDSARQRASQTAGPDGAMLLRQALEQQEYPELHEFAVANIAQLGFYEQASILYTVLRHRDPQVRKAAYRALGEMQIQIGERLPALNGA